MAISYRSHRERLILHAVAGRCGRHRQVEQWDVSQGMDRERQLLLAERTARLAIRFLAVAPGLIQNDLALLRVFNGLRVSHRH
jgi:hypothetical protein